MPILQLENINYGSAYYQGANYNGTSGTFYVPQGVHRLLVFASGGGGGAGNNGTSFVGCGGGGAGGYLWLAVTPGQAFPYIVGGGGSSPSGVGVGGNGGDTTVAGLTYGGGAGGGEDTGGAGGLINGSISNAIYQSGSEGGEGGFMQNGVAYPGGAFSWTALSGFGPSGGTNGLYGGAAGIPIQSIPTGYAEPGFGGASLGEQGGPGIVIFMW